MKHYIKKALPDLNIHSYVENNDGWDNIAIIINNDWLFRFPRKVEYAEKIPREKQLYDTLSSALTMKQLSVPHYHLLYDKQTDAIPICSYYKRIAGTPFTPSDLQMLTAIERHFITKQIALFLTTLHNVPVHQAKEWGFHIERPINYWYHIQKTLQHYASTILTDIEMEQLSQLFENFLEHITNKPVIQTVIHADFTHKHILFDATQKKLTGIIDIGDAHIDDPAFDFAGLYHDYGHAFTYEVYKRYTELTNFNDSTLFERVTQFYQYSPLFHNLIHSFETNDIHMIETNKQQLCHILQGRY